MWQFIQNKDTLSSANILRDTEKAKNINEITNMESFNTHS
jgi:hypothetical protein